MAGGYAHITLAQEAIEAARNNENGLLHADAKQALGYWKKFCIVGAVCPDYPYLDVLDSASAAWADAMHKGRAVELLRDGVARVRAMKDDDGKRQKCMAWLFGFASHVAADGTIHPVVNLKVGGAYEQHKTEHRRCEMSQDVYAHKRLNMGPLECNRQISSNVDDTSDQNNADLMDPDVVQLWQSMLNAVYAGRPQPKIHDWHCAMRGMMNAVLKGGDMLAPFVRHVAAGEGLVYPAAAEPEFLEGLPVPGGNTMSYGDIFSKARTNILELWGWLALSLQDKASPLDTLASWSLDSGIDEKNRMTYWS